MPQSEQQEQQSERRRKPHDAAYKSLFGHGRCVEDAVAGSAPEIAPHLDFSTLEKVESSFVTPALERRHADSIWRVRSRNGGWFHLLILLEFQSTVEPKMAKRILDYTLRLMDAHDAEHGAGGPYPPVLPVVIYNGKRPWTAATDVGELFAGVPDEVLRYLPRNRYLLIELQAMDPGELPAGNLVSMIAKLEQGGSDEHMAALVVELMGLIRPEDEEPLKRSFTSWVRDVVIDRGAVEGGKSLALRALEETEEGDMSGFADAVERWRDELLEKGMARGVERGMAQGVERGRQDMARRMAAHKFGEDGAERLAPVLAGISDPDRMASMVHECETVDELVERAANGT